MANKGLGRTLRHLRRLVSLTQEELAERSRVSVDVIRQLEQGRKHSARLPALHALANGLGVELTTLLGDPPAVSTGETDGPRFVAVRRAVMPVLWGAEPEPPGADFSLDRLREQIADGWTRYHAAEFDTVMKALRTCSRTRAPPRLRTTRAIGGPVSRPWARRFSSPDMSPCGWARRTLR